MFATSNFPLGSFIPYPHINTPTKTHMPSKTHTHIHQHTHTQTPPTLPTCLQTLVLSPGHKKRQEILPRGKAEQTDRQQWQVPTPVCVQLNEVARNRDARCERRGERWEISAMHVQLALLLQSLTALTSVETNRLPTPVHQTQNCELWNVILTQRKKA